MAESNTEQNIMVRQVTDVHANWSEQERGGPGALQTNRQDLLRYEQAGPDLRQHTAWGLTES